jgi:hypothetical protein
MRGDDLARCTFSCVSPEARVPEDCPLWKLWPLVDAALTRPAIFQQTARPG